MISVGPALHNHPVWPTIQVIPGNLIIPCLAVAKYLEVIFGSLCSHAKGTTISAFVPAIIEGMSSIVLYVLLGAVCYICEFCAVCYMLWSSLQVPMRP